MLTHLGSSIDGVSVRLLDPDFPEPEFEAWWRQHHIDPNVELDHFRLVCSFRRNLVRPAVFVISEKGQTTSILVGRLEDDNIQPKFGYLRLPSIKVRSLAIIHGGLIGSLTPAAAAKLLDHLADFISANHATRVSFHNLPASSPILAALAKSHLPTIGACRPQWCPHYQMEIGETPGFLLATMKSKHRSWVKKKRRDLEAAYPNALEWRWQSSFTDLESTCSQIDQVAKRTYQRGLGAGFQNTDAARSRLGLFAARGELRLQLLFINSQPRAFWYGTVSRGVFYSEATGYDPTLRSHEIGTLLFIQMVDELASEGVKTFDFGLGDAHYKQRFANRSWNQATAVMFVDSARGRLLRYYLLAINSIDTIARKTLTRLGIVDRVKRAWRRRLAGAAGASSDQSSLNSVDET